MKSRLLVLMLASLLACIGVVICAEEKDKEIQRCLVGLCKAFDFGSQFLQQRPSQAKQLAGTTSYPRLTSKTSDDINNNIANILIKGEAFQGTNKRKALAKTDRLVSFRQPRYNELKAKCFRQHEPTFSQAPSIHFYSHKSHVLSTRGCGRNLELSLKPTNGPISVNPELDAIQLKQQLIDTNLFNSRVETYILVHGFMTSWNISGSWVCDIKDLILDKSDANVFIVDWAGGTDSSNPIDYVKAVSNTIYVGALLGEFTRSLVEISGQLDASSYHMIGHSLGAHICGFAGYYLEGTLGRITGLDPAGPCFTAIARMAKTAPDDGYLNHGGRRLSRKSAQSVLVLHTDSSLFGLKPNCGHYDVYVNGGFQQPDCDPTSEFDINAMRIPIAPQFNINLLPNIPEFMTNKLACRHMYAYRIFNQFASVIDRESLGNGQIKVENHRRNRCRSVAYQCSSWVAFKAGECGFCLDGSSRCVYIGLKTYIERYTGNSDETKQSLPKIYYRSLTEDYDKPKDVRNVNDNDDDHQFNDEDEQRIGSKGSNGLLEEESMAEHSNGKYFIRSGRSPMTCMYSYQIVIAVSKQILRRARQTRKHFYYLHIPLEQSGRLTDRRDRRLNDRLIQVSHRLNPNSAAYNYIKSTYINSLIGGKPLAGSDDLDFYNALITFEPVTDANKCSPDDQTNGAGRGDKWQICHPLDNIKEARLWSSSDTNLEAVVWVGMNYMSGLDFEHRLKESYVFGRFVGEAVKVRSQVHKSNQPSLTGSLSSKRSSPFANPIASAARSLDCLLSVFDTSSDGDARRKFKCERSNKELLYAIRLKPNKLGDK